MGLGMDDKNVLHQNRHGRLPLLIQGMTTQGLIRQITMAAKLRLAAIIVMRSLAMLAILHVLDLRPPLQSQGQILAGLKSRDKQKSQPQA